MLIYSLDVDKNTIYRLSAIISSLPPSPPYFNLHPHLSCTWRCRGCFRRGRPAAWCSPWWCRGWRSVWSGRRTRQEPRSSSPAVSQTSCSGCYEMETPAARLSSSDAGSVTWCHSYFGSIWSLKDLESGVRWMRWTFFCSLPEEKILLKPKVGDGPHADFHHSSPGCHNNAFPSTIYLSWLEELGKSLVSGQSSWKQSHRGVRAQIKRTDRKWCQAGLHLNSEEDATTFFETLWNLDKTCQRCRFWPFEGRFKYVRTQLLCLNFLPKIRFVSKHLATQRTKNTFEVSLIQWTFKFIFNSKSLRSKIKKWKNDQS